MIGFDHAEGREYPWLSLLAFRLLITTDMDMTTKSLGWITMPWLCLVAAGITSAAEPAISELATATLQQIGSDRGVCAILGLPQDGNAAWVIELARAGHGQIYFQSSRAEEVGQVREAAAAAGLLGKQVFADLGENAKIHLAENLADAVIVAPQIATEVDEVEVLRVLHPDGVGLLGSRRLVKQRPEGVDQWSHVFHAPDNNPLSTDQFARAPYLTHFLAAPLFVPMPEVSVAAGGRVFRAFGHIAHRANQNAYLNTLICVNGYNGTILWQQRLHEGFMIHRNTMIATPATLYLGDDESCKLFEARTGQLKDQLVVPAEVADGKVWKWMALESGADGRAILYALVGGEEIRPHTIHSEAPSMGHWPWGMWEGHAYSDPKTNFGFGRTLLAIDPATKKILWSHREDDYLDARGVCLKNGCIYCYSPDKFLACLETSSGHLAWKNSDRNLLDAIGRDGPAQNPYEGYATTTFIKCNEHEIFFAGPQRKRLVVASTENGKLLWQKEPGNLQIVLRGDSLYGAGRESTFSLQLACATGEQLGELPARRACTRATGTLDSIFYRARGGTVRLDLLSGIAKHIAPMRPPCQDGVIVSDGLLYWGPWMCGCELSLYGHICLGSAGAFNFHPPLDNSRWSVGSGDPLRAQPFAVQPDDWPTDQHDSQRSSVTPVRLPPQVARHWTYQLPGQVRPTAPIIAGGVVFIGDDSGAVSAVDAADGALRWRTYVGGAIFSPPALWHDRLYAGSADGRVYAIEAATGRLLWSFRAAPDDRWIPVYGRLLSTWPVAGGVVVQDGMVYAAAGIAHYDGTYVYALDAVTGKVKWCNDTSGNLSEKVECGISLQGPLYLAGSELRFLGGGKYEIARYDRASGKCLNPVDDSLMSQFRTAFYPYFPQYGQYMSLSHTLSNGKELIYDASYEGSVHSRLSLMAPLPPGMPPPLKQEARWPQRPPKGQPRPTLWSDSTHSRFHSFIVTPDGLLTAGEVPVAAPVEPFLAAIDIATGRDLWREKLPAAAVRGGTAIDHYGRIIVALNNGQIVAFAKPNP